MDAGQLREFERAAHEKVKAIQLAIAASEALGWFGDYSGALKSGGRDSANVEFRLFYAASTAFVSRAESYLDRAAQQMMPSIVDAAIKLAERDLAQGIEASGRDGTAPSRSDESPVRKDAP